MIKALSIPNPLETTIKAQYRESTLTRILEGSVGGNSQTVLIITCSPLAKNATETLGTLKFGERAKKIKSNPMINNVPTPEAQEARLAKLEKQVRLEMEKNIKNKEKEK